MKYPSQPFDVRCLASEVGREFLRLRALRIPDRQQQSGRGERSRHLSPWLCTLGLLAAAGAWAGPMAKAPSPDRSTLEPGFHIVRPGETLHDLAERYVGDRSRWPELARINPAVRDPHRIFPGQRLRVVRDLSLPTSLTARVDTVERRVEERPSPVPWLPSLEGDLLLEQDSLRTFSNSSARLRFLDGSSLTLVEDSLVFLRRSKAPASGAEREIEVLQGQADVQARPDAAFPPAGIDILLGEVRTRTRRAPESELHTRARLDAARTAQVMAFRGNAEVAAAGKRVELPPGTGSSIPAAGPPSSPEPLLASPRVLQPADGEAVERSEIVLSWEPVAGAASYWIELCRDATCGAVLHRQALASDTSSIRVQDLGLPSFYWRVTARSRSGLDGYPSVERKVEVVEELPLPVPGLALFGADGQALEGTCFAVPPRFQVEARTAQGQPLAWNLIVNGTAEDPAVFDARSGVLGRYEVTARVFDSKGRFRDAPAVAFTVDPVAPWIEIRGGTGGPDRATLARWARQSEQRRSRSARPLRCGEFGLTWVDSSGSTTPVPCSASEPLELDPGSAEELRGRLRVVGATLRLGERAESRPGEEFELLGQDLGCGVARVELWLAPEAGGTGFTSLHARIRDRAGNEQRAFWRIEAPVQKSR